MSVAEDRLRRLEAVTDSALSHLDVEKLLRELLERVRDLLNADTATVLLHDRSAGQLVAAAAVGLEDEVRQGVRIAVGDGFAGQVALRRRPIIVPHVDENSVRNPLLWEKGLQVLLGVPMLVAGTLVGVLHVGSVTPRSFTDDDVQLLQLAADRIALATQAQVSSAERSAAAALQRSLLPPRLPEMAGLQFAARYVPGADTRVGGDWYDVFALPENRWGIVVGDVAGHGLPAAVIMGRLRSALRAYALLVADDPADVLEKLDRKATHFESGAMATVLYAVLDSSLQSLRVSVAGHPPPVLAVPGQPARLLDIPPDPPIGTRYIDRRRNTVVEIPLGSVLCFYTDGLVERRDALIDVGLARLCQAVVANSPDVVCAKVMSAMTGSEPADDDVALLVMRRIAAAARL